MGGFREAASTFGSGMTTHEACTPRLKCTRWSSGEDELKEWIKSKGKLERVW